MRSDAKPSRHTSMKKVPRGQPRARPINSCLTCRDRKKGCDRSQPVCSSCIQNPDPNKPCVYYVQDKSDILKAHKRKMQSLKEDFASNVAKRSTYGGSKVAGSPICNTLVAVEDISEDDTDDDDDDAAAADVSIKIGKLRISEHIGGCFCPRMLEELKIALKISPRFSTDEVSLPQDYSSSVIFAEPGPNFLAPENHNFRASAKALEDGTYFPERQMAECLLARYWECVHPIARVLHKRTFTKKWMAFWEDCESGRNINKSSLALIFTTLFAGLVSTPEDVVQSQLKHEKQILMQKIRAGADRALARTQWIHSAKIEVLQAVVIYLISLCRDEVSSAHSNIVAAAIRAAEGMGLHEDGTTYGYSPVHTHIRRLVWYQLLILDIRTCEATGSRPLKRIGDFSTRMPVNIDEDEVENSPDDTNCWTDMTVTIVRFRCNEFMRDILSELLRLRKNQVEVGEILSKIQTFETYMERMYGQLAKLDVPIQRYGILVTRVLTLHTYTMVLHQYAFHSTSAESTKFKDSYIRYGVQTMNAVQELETSRNFGRWRWLAGATQQYQCALAMLLELLSDPYLCQAEPILNNLDYVFEPPPELGPMPLTRLRYIVTELQNRIKFFVIHRKLRIHKDMQQLQDQIDMQKSKPSTAGRSTCNSATNLEVSAASDVNAYLDEQLVSPPSIKSSFRSSPQCELSSPRQIGDFLTSPTQPDPCIDSSQLRSANLEAPSLMHFSREMVDANLVVYTNTHLVHETDGCLTNQPELMEQRPQRNTGQDYVPNPDDETSLSANEYPIEALESYESAVTNDYLIDAFTGYCSRPSFNNEYTYLASSLNSTATQPINNITNAPTLENIYGSPDMNGPQQNTSACSTAHPFPQCTQTGLFGNGIESTCPGLANPIDSNSTGKGGRQHCVSIPGQSLPTADALDVHGLTD